MKVKLTKKCQLAVYFDEDDKGNEINAYQVVEPGDSHNFFPALSGYLSLEEGFTLRHFFEFLNKYNLLDYHKGIRPFYAWYEKYCKSGPLTTDLKYEYLEYDRGTYINRNKIYYQRKLAEKMKKMTFKIGYDASNIELTVRDSLMVAAVVEHEDECMHLHVGDIELFSISMLPLTKIIDLEIRIAPREIVIEKDRERYKDFEHREEERFFVDDWRLTLIQFIYGVMESITAWGDTPEENEANAEQLYDRLDQAKDQDKEDNND